MLRRLFTLLSALSLVLCVAVVVLWVRSYGVFDYVQWTDHRHFPKGDGDAMTLAARGGHAGVIARLLDAGLKVSRDLLDAASDKNHRALAERLLKLGVSAKGRRRGLIADWCERPASEHPASMQDESIGMIRLLLGAGAEIDDPDETGMTGLLYAAPAATTGSCGTSSNAERIYARGTGGR